MALRITDPASGPENYQEWADYYNLSRFLNYDGTGTRPWVRSTDNNNFESALILLYNQGLISASDLQGYLNYVVYRGYDESFEKWLDNQIALENTNSARQWEQQMAETSLLRSSDQLKQLGLSPSTVLQAGGSNVNPVAAADNVKTNMAQQRYEQRMGITKSLISMVSGMASAGIGGTALGLARGALARQGMATAHNALGLLGSKDLNKVGFAKYADSHKGPGAYIDLNDAYYGPSWDQLMKMFEN